MCMCIYMCYSVFDVYVGVQFDTVLYYSIINLYTTYTMHYIDIQTWALTLPVYSPFPAHKERSEL